MNQINIQRISAALAFLIGSSLVIGGVAELVGVLLESQLPQKVQATLQQIHHLFVIKALVAFVGVMSLGIGVQMLRSYRGILSRKKASILRLQSACWALIAMVMSSQVVLSITLYPKLHTLPLQGPFPHFWLFSMIGAAIGPLAMAGFLLFLCRQLHE